MRQTKSATNQSAVPEDLSHLSWPGIGTYIKVLWRPVQEDIPYTTPNEIGKESPIFQAIEYFKDIPIDQLPGKVMVGP